MVNFFFYIFVFKFCFFIIFYHFYLEKSINYPVHSLCLHKNAVFVLTFKLTSFTSIESIGHWVNIIEDNFVEGSSVIIVGTMRDKNKSLNLKIIQTYIQEKFFPKTRAKIQLVTSLLFINSLSNSHAVEDSILSTVELDLSTTKMGEPIDIKYEIFYNVLYHEAKTRNHPVLHLSEVSSIAESCNISSSLFDKAMEYLKMVGKLFRFPCSEEDSNDLIVMKPSFIFNLFERLIVNSENIKSYTLAGKIIFFFLVNFFFFLTLFFFFSLSFKIRDP